jgi:carbamoylphosphate synthase large subunit
MGKTVKQALIDAIHYPIPEGFVENCIIERQLNGDDTYTYEVSQSNEYKGALADCLFSLLQAVSIHESDKSFGTLTDKDKERLLVRIRNLYEAIGEEVELGQPMVYIGG